MSVERTPIGLQHVLPGAERDPAGLARKRVADKLQAPAPQKPCDHGLFSDAALQTDLVDYIRGRKP